MKFNLNQKLLEIQKKVSYLQKDTKGFNYKYVSGTSVLSTIRTEMDNLGLLLKPSIKNKEVQLIEGKKTEFMVYGDMSFIWVDVDNKEEKEEELFAYFGKQDDPSKAFGSALTYSERYFLLKFFHIATDEDDPDKYQKKQEVKNQVNHVKTLKEYIAKQGCKNEAEANKLLSTVCDIKIKDLNNTNAQDILIKLKK